MPHRPHSSPRSTSPLLLALAAALLTIAPSEALAQRLGGSIGVSLTVLEPVATQPVQVTALRVGRDGVATVETTAPTTGPTSQLLMARVSSSTRADGGVPSAVMLGAARGVSGDRLAGAGRISHRVDVGRTPTGAPTRDVQLRIEYLAVAGT
jgi:hypothetical protein